MRFVKKIKLNFNDPTFSCLVNKLLNARTRIMDLSILKKESLLDKENVIVSEHYKTEKQNLRETEKMRTDGINQLKNWIQQNSDIVHCITDDNFLLRFLRVRKFSIPMAQQTLLKYLNFRQKFHHVLCNLDHTEPRICDLIEKGYVYVSPFRDCNGRRVIIYNFSSINLQKTTSLDIQRADALTFETLVDNEESQIMGVTHIIQTCNIGPAIVPLFYSKEFAHLIKWGEQSFPMRHKVFIVLDVAPSIKFFFDITKNLLSSKLRERILLDETSSSLQEKVGKKCLPLELGGTVPAKEMMALWKEEMEAKRERILSLDKMVLLSDKGIITRRNCPKQDDESLSGSFRKLEID